MIAAGRLAQNYTERASLQDTYTNLLAVASYQSMRLWLMDSNGKILIDTAVGFDQSKITQLDSFDPVSLSGNYYQTGRFFDYFDEDMLSVVAPITSNYITKGYIAVHFEKNIGFWSVRRRFFSGTRVLMMPACTKIWSPFFGTSKTVAILSMS